MTCHALPDQNIHPAPSCFPSSAVFRLAIPVLVSVLLWAGCAMPQVKERHGPTRVTGAADPAIEVQSRLLQDARLSFAQGRYETATLLLRRLIKNYPQSPLLTEAHWWLARSYEQAGEMKEALTQYRVLAQTAQGGSFGLQAKSRLAELERTLGGAPNRISGPAAILIPSHRLPAQSDLDEWVRQLAQTGFTVVVVEAGTSSGRGENGMREPDEPPQQQTGVYFRTHWASTIRDVVGQLVPVAHRHGVRVFAAIALRQMNWLASELRWTDQAYDPVTRQFVASGTLDLLHPALQEYLLGLLTDLAAGGVDGILFRADAPSGFTEGFSPYGLKGFERDFGIKLDPATLYASAGFGALTGSRQDYGPEFWRWAGWKTRETLKIMDRLRLALHKQSPMLQVALEVHPEAVTDPVKALVRWNEDLLEAKRLRFNYYVIGGDTPLGSGKGERMSGIIERAVELIGDAGLIWMAMPLPSREIVRGETGLKPEIDRASFVKGVGIIYLPRVGPEGGSFLDNAGVLQ